MALPRLPPSLNYVITFSLCMVCLFVSMHGVEFEDSLYQIHDGSDRLTELTDRTFTSSVATDTWVVWFRNGATEAGADKLDGVYNDVLQLSAQSLEGKGVSFGFVQQSKYPAIFTTQGAKPGSIFVYRNSKKTPFVGYRSPDVLVSFIRKISGPIVNVIDGKASKKDFDSVKTTKVVGFFEQNSPAYQQYEAAANEHHPNIPFFAVFDPLVEEHVQQLTNVSGNIAIVRKKDKVVINLAKNPATAADISRAIAADGRDLFRHVTADEVHTLLQTDVSVNRLYVFSRKSSQEARDFYKALKKAARGLVARVDLEIRVIDPEELPMVVPFWESTFKIDTNKAMIGKVDLAKGWSTWLDAAQIAGAVDAAERQLVIENWINLWVYNIKPGEETPILPPPGQSQQAAGGQPEIEGDLLQSEVDSSEAAEAETEEVGLREETELPTETEDNIVTDKEDSSNDDLSAPGKEEVEPNLKDEF